jgi:L-iditol 2-dehydrogenase
MTMKAAVTHGIRDIRYEEYPKPKCPENSILVKIHACAICGTDKRIYTVGDYRAQYPVIIGHEIAGEVVEVAQGVTSVKIGDRVCVAPGHGCGYCKACKLGAVNLCVNPHPSLGFTLDGGFAQYIAVPEHIFRLGFVNVIPGNLSYDEAAMSEIIACCLNAHKNTAVEEGDVVLILGAGPAGIIHAMLSTLKGASKVILAQRSRFRLDQAEALFPEYISRTVAMDEEDLDRIIAEETEGYGVDCTFVCAPSKDAQENAIKLSGPRGRINFFGGLPKGNHIIAVDANTVHYKELVITGASSSLPETNREALRLLSEGKINGKKLITDTFPLSRVQEALELAESKACIKVVLHPWEQ